MQSFHVFFRISPFPIRGSFDRQAFLALASHMMLCIYRVLSLFSCLGQRKAVSTSILFVTHKYFLCVSTVNITVDNVSRK